MTRTLPAAILAATLALTQPFAAAADACRDEIAALYDGGGALDPFARPPHRQKVQDFDADGAEIRATLNLFETPMRTIAGVPDDSQFTMAAGRDLWNGPSPEGPWQKLDFQMPEGRDDAMRAALVQERANLTDTACHGAEADGLLHYTYRTRTDPDTNGVFYGALNDLWIDAETGHPMRMEKTESIASWFDGVAQGRQVIVFEYDDSIRIVTPE